LKTIGHSLKNLSPSQKTFLPPLVFQAGYGPADSSCIVQHGSYNPSTCSKFDSPAWSIVAWFLPLHANFVKFVCVEIYFKLVLFDQLIMSCLGFTKKDSLSTSNLLR